MMKRAGYILLLLIAGAFCAPADLHVDLTYIGNPGNAPDEPYLEPGVLVGAVSYTYYISTYEVTAAQYTEFLNAKAASDPYGLYHTDMADERTPGGAIILRSGSSGSYSYTAVSGREDQPVRFVSFYDGLRMANWLHNGQGSGDTETGAYTISDGLYLERNTGARWALASKDEWHKAAYYDADSETYREYPNGKDTIEAPTDQTTPRELNFGASPYWAPDGPLDRHYFTSIGETTGYSTYGVFDMGGNAEEWTDSLVPPEGDYDRVVRGGTFDSSSTYLARTMSYSQNPEYSSFGRGLRLVCLVPEPATVELLLLGFVACLLRRKGRT
jgi:formylglycine-generating enzyme required for sulfatase activity